MLAYAAGRQRIAERRSSPSTMLIIVGGHVALLAAAMSAKFIVDAREETPPTEVRWVKPVEPPKPEPRPQTEPPKQPTQSSLDQTRPVMPTPIPQDPVDTTPMPPLPPTQWAGNSTMPTPKPDPIVLPVRKGPRLATPEWALEPPYPSSKLDSQEEEALRLRLSIDERGRVVAVDPVGPADAAFLNAARKHLLAKWRYQPATVDGKPIASSTVITLRFELQG